jgi:hypothetical protein
MSETTSDQAFTHGTVFAKTFLGEAISIASKVNDYYAFLVGVMNAFLSALLSEVGAEAALKEMLLIAKTIERSEQRRQSPSTYNHKAAMDAFDRGWAFGKRFLPDAMRSTQGIRDPDQFFVGVLCTFAGAMATRDTEIAVKRILALASPLLELAKTDPMGGKYPGV